MVKARARDRLLRLADQLGATVYTASKKGGEGHTWFVLHYGVGDIIDNPAGHSSWDCLGRLVYVATAREDWGGHGYTWNEVQAVIRCPWDAMRVDRRTVMVLPDGIDATTAAMLSRCCKDEFEEEYFGLEKQTL